MKNTIVRTIVRRQIIFGLFFFCLCKIALASVSLHKAKNIDLSNNAVIDMYQDSCGYMWIGTYDGLNLYNGKQTYTYRFEPNNKNTLCSNIIHKITDAGIDCLWISTSMGLNKFSLEERRVIESYPEYPECVLVATDKKGNSLLVGLDNFISCYSPNVRSFQDIYVPGVNMETIKVLFANGKERFFMLTASAILKEMKPDFSSLPLNLNIQEKPIHNKNIDQAFYEDGHIFFIDMEGELFRYRIADGEKAYLTNLSTLMSKQGRISGILTYHSNVYVSFRNGLFLNLGDQGSTQSLNIGIFCLMKDRKQDILWMGTDGQGIQMYYNKYNRFGALMLQDLPLAMRNPVRSVYTDDDNTLWVGSKGDGFIRVEDYDSYGDNPVPLSRISRYTTDNGLSSNRVYCFCKSRYHSLVWIGTEGPGLSYYSKKDRNVHTLTSEANTKIQYVHSICEINDSTLWMATTGCGLLEVGIKEKNSQLVIKYVNVFVLEKEGKICKEFHTLSFDGKSTLYLGSRGGYGMARFDLLTKQYDFVSMNNSGNRAIGDVLCLCYSRDSTFYLGASSGMTRVKFSSGKPTEVRQFNKTDGIVNDMIHGVLEDEDGCLWLSTNKGLTKYNPHNNFFHNYNTSDLRVMEFSDDAYWKCPYTDRLFFGGIDGLVWIDSQNDRLENYKPDLRFFDLRVGVKTISLLDYNGKESNTLNIPSDISTFSVSFVATDYIHGENYEYAYRMDNFNTSWVELQKNNEITFTRLPYGKYVLKVRYKNDVIDSNAKEYRLYIHVLPPWYLSPWAIVIYVFLVLMLCIGIAHWSYLRIVSKQQEVAWRIREEQKAKLYEAKLNFFTNITHELCTPLTLINGVTKYIREHIETKEDAKLTKYTSVLEENVQGLNGLILEILDFRKIEEAGFSPVQLKKVSITGIIRQQIELFGAVADQNNIQLQSSFPDMLYWNTDVACFRKIIINLMSNAFKYTEQGGIVNISVLAEKDGLVLKVYNSGKGIDETDLLHVFDRYRILDNVEGNDYTQMTSRTGLGLFICHSLVKSLKGVINVKSKLGEYVEFTVCLPFLDMPKEEEGEQEESDVFQIEKSVSQTTGLEIPRMDSYVPGGKPIILVVDDNKDIVWFVREVLESVYTIREAFSVDEALKSMEQQTPSLIITDIMMPGIDGLELISRIKADKFTRYIPLVIVSAKISERDQAEGLDLGADAYLTKPFSSLVLRSVVNRLVSTKKELKEYYYSPESAYENSGGQLTHQEDKMFMDSVIAIIKENLEEDNIRPELIAVKLGMNTRSLYRRFKKISPLTPSDFIKDYRFVYAAQLLVTTSLNVQEIIYKVGISNKSYFYREFARKYNVTPKEYRENR